MTNVEHVKNYKIWLKALRSGKWKQSRNMFHGYRGGHCCLGVGQIVLGLPEEESTHKLQRPLGLIDKDIDYLIGLNDNGHRSFSYIADKIEEKILPRFLTKA